MTTPEQFNRIMAVIRKVTWHRESESFSWGPNPNDGAEAKALILEIGGSWAKKKNCFGCYMDVLNQLHVAVGLPPVTNKIPQSRTEARLAKCHACPAYHADTESCGRLIADFLAPQPVEIDGMLIQPCGCYLPIKATIKWATCPANKW